MKSLKLLLFLSLSFFFKNVRSQSIEGIDFKTDLKSIDAQLKKKSFDRKYIYGKDSASIGLSFKKNNGNDSIVGIIVIGSFNSTRPDKKERRLYLSLYQNNLDIKIPKKYRLTTYEKHGTDYYLDTPCCMYSCTQYYFSKEHLEIYQNKYTSCEIRKTYKTSKESGNIPTLEKTWIFISEEKVNKKDLDLIK